MARPVIQRVEALESTQDEIHRQAGLGAPAGTAIQAAEQRGGRGTRGRAWTSPRGGLWLSVLLRPGVAPRLEGLSLRVGLAIADTLEGLGVGPLAVKWPNDLMAEGRKVGGILCEARWVGDQPGWVAVGVGINVRNPVPDDLASAATSLAALGWHGGPDDLAAPVAEAVAAAGLLSGPLTSAELARFARRDWLLGRALAGPVPGTAAGIEADGALRVRTSGGGVVSVTQSVTLAGVASSSGTR